MPKEFYEVKREPLSEDAELRTAIYTAFEPFAESDDYYDLKEVGYEDIVSKVHSLVVACNVALHGSDSREPYNTLDPAFSRQLTKVPSIYATTDVRVALKSAVFRRHSPLVQKIGHGIDEGNGFAASMYVHDRQVIFEAPPGIAQTLRDALEIPSSPLFDELFTDGIIYIAAGRLFLHDNPSLGEGGLRVGGTDFTDHELNTPEEVTPLAALRVSKQLAYELFKMDGEDRNVYIYNEGDMEIRRQRNMAARAIKERLLGNKRPI